jgi:hypothetical protein
MKAKKTPLWLELLGWYGPIAIIAGFGLVSFGIVEARSYPYQLINLTGSLGILAISLSKRVYQSVVLNAFMIAIAVITLVQLMV